MSSPLPTGGPPTAAEPTSALDCFGGRCTVTVAGDGPLGRPDEALTVVRAQLAVWHRRFSRFLASSELSALNADPRATVPVSPAMAMLAAATAAAAAASGGLVDATFPAELARAGYAGDLAEDGLDLRVALARAPERRPAAADPRRRWAAIRVAGGAVTRPPGVCLDSGGLAKGLFADLLAARLTGHARYVVNLCGDLRLGGTEDVTREVRIDDPFAPGRALHAFALTGGAVATSGIGRRRWTGEGGRPAHHLLDPSTGRPAWTGLVQATALAPTAVEAEWRAKAALLSGPEAAATWLPHGGLIVGDDGSARLVAPPRRPCVRAALRGGRLVLSELPVAA